MGGSWVESEHNDFVVTLQNQSGILRYWEQVRKKGGSAGDVGSGGGTKPTTKCTASSNSGPMSSLLRFRYLPNPFQVASTILLIEFSNIALGC